MEVRLGNIRHTGVYSKAMATMNISLPAELGKYVRRLIASGLYSSASEVMREGLRALQEREETLRVLRAELQVGVHQLERGQTYTLQEVREHLTARRATRSKRKVRRHRPAR